MARPLPLLLSAAAAALLVASPAAAGPVRDRIYPAPKAPLSLEGLPAGAVKVTVRTADGLTLSGINLPARAGMPVLLVLHGNASSAADTVRWLAPVAAAGYGLLAAEYRGYSDNPGLPSAAGLAEDAAAFLKEARSRAGSGPVWVVGHSLGAGVAIATAKREKLDALVTIGAFTRLRAAAPKMVRAFVPKDYDNLAAVPDIDEPWFLIHGTADDVIPVTEAKTLHAAASAAHRIGSAFAIAGAGHKPDAAQILVILEAVRAWFAAGEIPAQGLPAAVRPIPFAAAPQPPR